MQLLKRFDSFQGCLAAPVVNTGTVRSRLKWATEKWPGLTFGTESLTLLVSRGQNILFGRPEGKQSSPAACDSGRNLTAISFRKCEGGVSKLFYFGNLGIVGFGELNCESCALARG